MHQQLACELRAPSHGRIRLVGRNFAEALAFGKRHFARHHYIEPAFRRPDKLRRLFFGESKIDEYCRIVDFDLQFFCSQGRFEGQREVERENIIRVVEPIARGGLREIRFFAVGRREREVIEFLQRFDIDLRKWCNSSRVNLPFSLLSIPCVAKVENMSSNDHA